MTPPPSAAAGRRATGEVAGAELRDRLLSATRALLDQRRYESISVADIIATAGVSRASFYFYFPGKAAVLAELVRRAVAQGHVAAQPWTESRLDPAHALRAGVADGYRLWQDNAGVLMAIVESWGTDDDLRQLWLDQMGSFTDAAVSRIEADPAVLSRLEGLDVRAVAASLTWLGERVYYLAAAGVPPFTDEKVVVDTLTHAWRSALHEGS